MPASAQSTGARTQERPILVPLGRTDALAVGEANDQDGGDKGVFFR